MARVRINTAGFRLASLAPSHRTWDNLVYPRDAPHPILFPVTRPDPSGGLFLGLRIQWPLLALRLIRTRDRKRELARRRLAPGVGEECLWV